MKTRILALAAAIVLAGAGLGWAQETTGSITGRVVDAQGLAVPGASVTVTGPQGSRTLTTDADGRFSATLLTPGRYSVRSELQGFKAAEAKDVIVGLGQTSVALSMEVGAMAETVEVTGASTVVDTNSTTIGGVLDSETLKRLPVGRNFTDTLYLVPGVSDSSGVGKANPSIGGASGLENSYIVDGVNITDTGFGGVGAYNSVHGSLGSGVTVDFIRETQVKTGGYEAEFGQSTGGVVNVVTKSGANQFSGGVFGYVRPSATEASWDTLTTPNGTVNTTARDEYDFGISIGGRIIPDRLFFYGTYNPQFQNRSFIAPEGFPYRGLGDVKRERVLQSYAGKLTAQLNTSNRIDFSVFGDPSKGKSGLQRFTTLRRIAYAGAPGTTDIRGGYSELEYGGHNQTVRYDGIISPNWLIEASGARATNKFNEIPTLDDWFFRDVRFVPQGSSGGLGSYERDNGKNAQVAAKSTHLFRAGGSHQIRYGVQFEQIEFTRDFDYSGPNMTLADGRQTVTGGFVDVRSGGGVNPFFRAIRGKLVNAAPTTQDYRSFFIQDTWQMGRLTVRPGVRYERQYLEGQDPGGSFPDLCFPNDTRPGAGDGSGNAIACNFTWEQWAPRIGATFDLFGNGRAKAYTNWGRFYAKIPNDLAARAMSADTGITRQNFRDPGLSQPVPNGELFAGSTAHLLLTSDHAAIIDPNAGSTYKDEFLAGVEFEVFGSANLGFRYVHRTMPQILEDIGQLSVVGYYVAPDTPVDYFMTNVNAGTQAVQCCGYTVGFEDPSHTYDSFEITLNKRFANNWGLVGSYRFARLEGNFEGFFRSDNGQSDPAITSLFDFPTNDPSYTGLGTPEFGFEGDIRYQGTTLGAGRLPNDRPHQVKVYGNYLWKDLNVGAGLNVGSGRVLTALASNPVYANAGEIPLTIRGGGMETRDGFQERAPIDATVDLHADYTVRIAGQNLLLLADVFNLFNRQTATDYDTFYETTFGTLNPNFGYAANGGGTSSASFQPPLAVRFGARFEW